MASYNTMGLTMVMAGEMVFIAMELRVMVTVMIATIIILGGKEGQKVRFLYFLDARLH